MNPTTANLADLAFVQACLPNSYVITPASRPGAIHCVSPTGIAWKENEDDEHWQLILQAFRQHFGDRFLEVDHQVNHNHVDFTVYLRA
jgi:hypothetical protein